MDQDNNDFQERIWEIEKDLGDKIWEQQERSLVDVAHQLGYETPTALSLDSFQEALYHWNALNRGFDTAISDKASAIEVLTELGVEFDENKLHEGFTLFGVEFIVSEFATGCTLLNSAEFRKALPSRQELFPTRSSGFYETWRYE